MGMNGLDFWTRLRYLANARVVAGAIGCALAMLLMLAFAYSRWSMEGAKLFGGLAEQIKNHQAATAGLAIGSAALLWIGLGVFAVAQEWLAARRRSN
jgi:hypothetical protein